ncbi:MAG: hypothetical protein M0004_08190 [Actinomycetota bacterium]|nr:hypothetical protein [Actinomycetota bacterium]
MDEIQLPLRIHALRAVEVVAAMRAAESLTGDSCASAREADPPGCAKARPVDHAA